MNYIVVSSVKAHQCAPHAAALALAEGVEAPQPHARLVCTDAAVRPQGSASRVLRDLRVEGFEGRGF